MSFLQDLTPLVYQLMDDDIKCSALSPESGYSEGGMSPEMTLLTNYQDQPYIEIIDQPQNSFRFRYLKESSKPHGPLRGAQSARSASKQMKSGPKVKLHNFNGEAIIRCWLSLPNSRNPHVHHLVGSGEQGVIKYEPHDIKVSSSNNYTASFDKLNIIHVVLNKEEYCRAYYEKKLQIESRDYKKPENYLQSFDQNAVKKEMKGVEKNLASLYFQVFVQINGQYMLITDAISEPIKNKKNPNTSDLRITRQSSVKGPCEGGQEIFIFVEKVIKGIKIKFFEEDPETNEEVWSDFAQFGPLDIHHQVAVAFRTPKYRDQTITEEVKVFFQLVRESDESVSPPVAYYYQPSENTMYDFSDVSNKKRRLCLSSSLKTSYNDVPQIEQIQIPPDLSQLITIPLSNDSSSNNLDVYSTNGFLDFQLNEEFHQNIGVEQLLDIPDFPLIATDGFQESTSDAEDEEKETVTRNIENRTGSVLDAVEELNQLLHQTIVNGDDGGLQKIIASLPKETSKIILNGRNSLNKSPLQMAVHVGNIKSILTLLECGCEFDFIDIPSNTALHSALVHSSECMRILMKRYSMQLQTKCNAEGDNLLLLATREGCTESLKILLDNHWDINFQNLKNGDSSLHIATKYNFDELVEFLVEQGANVNLQNYSGYTPIHFAASDGMASILKTLMTGGVKLKYTKEDSITEEENENDTLKGPNVYDYASNDEIKQIISSRFHTLQWREPENPNGEQHEITEFLNRNKNISCQIADKMKIGFLKPAINASEHPSKILVNYLKENHSTTNPIELLDQNLSKLCLNKCETNSD